MGTRQHACTLCWILGHSINTRMHVVSARSFLECIKQLQQKLIKLIRDKMVTAYSWVCVRLPFFTLNGSHSKPSLNRITRKSEHFYSTGLRKSLSTAYSTASRWHFDRALSLTIAVTVVLPYAGKVTWLSCAVPPLSEIVYKSVQNLVLKYWVLWRMRARLNL